MADNKWFEWLFDGIGATALVGLIAWLYKKKFPEKEKKDFSLPSIGLSNTNSDNNQSNINVYNNSTVNTNLVNSADNKAEKLEIPSLDRLDKLKSVLKILFIDDDVKFKVVSILKKSGWIHTKTVKDISDLDNITVKDVDIFFVDIQGVGKALNFKDEGLGLAVALKKKYPLKKVVIYSAQTVGERFHEGFRKADTLLAKDAEPYEFQQIVEQFGMEIYKDK